MTDERAETVRQAVDSYYDRNGDWTVTKRQVRDLLAAYDERLRVNVGLVMENTELRKQVRGETVKPDLAAMVAEAVPLLSGLLAVLSGAASQDPAPSDGDNPRRASGSSDRYQEETL